MSDNGGTDEKVQGAEPRDGELIEQLDEIKSTPPDPVGEWPSLGERGGTAKVGDDDDDLPGDRVSEK